MKKPIFFSMSAPVKGFPSLGARFFDQIAELVFVNRHNMFDDFFEVKRSNRFEKAEELISKYAPYFWAIVDPESGELAGIVYLYDIIGTRKKLYSAHISTCFARKFWGDFVQAAAHDFFTYIREKLCPEMLFAEVYDYNLLGKRLVEKLGFTPYAVFSDKTVCNGRPTTLFSYILSTNNQ